VQRTTETKKSTEEAIYHFVPHLTPPSCEIIRLKFQSLQGCRVYVRNFRKCSSYFH